MKSLKFTNQTATVALVIFTVYFVYGLFRLPAVQFLVSLAIGGLAFGLSDSYEVATVALIFMHLLYPILYPSPVAGYRAYAEEGFMSGGGSGGGITQRIQGILKREPVEGVGSPMTEGFEDAQQTDMTVNEQKKESASSANTTATSKPAAASSAAPTTATAPTTQAPTQTQAPAQATTQTQAPTQISAQGVPPVTQPPESFANQNELFKLGSIPADTKGGFHIDAGTTVMNALKALKPDQIAAMTNDTKQLIETQKSLMGMLQSFQPMVAEGKQLMTTFQDMFGPAAGSLNTAQNMLSMK